MLIIVILAAYTFAIQLYLAIELMIKTQGSAMTKRTADFDVHDWDGFHNSLDQIIDACTARLKTPMDYPWQQYPDGFDDLVTLDGTAKPQNDVINEMLTEIMPYGSGNTHPAFFGWVQGSGTPLGLAADMVASTMNTNAGGRNSGAVRVERAVVKWTAEVAGFPDTASGILTTGTSQATIIAMIAARTKKFGEKVLTDGIHGIGPIAVYAADGVHSCVAAALQVLGHGRNAIRKIATDDRGAMQLDALADAIAADRAAGVTPMAIAATAGSVNTGSYDPIDALADVAKDNGMWLHIDGAFGFWTRLADTPWGALANGMERADSVATDFHKWLSVPYDCGIVVIRDGELHRRSFADRPEYLRSQAAGLGGGDLWFCDYGFDLSRGFRALKVWAAIRAFGNDHIGQVISKNCAQAALMGDLIEASDVLELRHPVISNVCCFEPVKGKASEISTALQLSGNAVFSTTTLDGVNCLRAAIVNHRTTDQVVRDAVAQIETKIRTL